MLIRCELDRLTVFFIAKFTVVYGPLQNYCSLKMIKNTLFFHGFAITFGIELIPTNYLQPQNL